MTVLDMSPEAIAQRLRAVSTRADLDPAHRLHAKLDVSPPGIVRRLRTVGRLRRLCLKLARCGTAAPS